MERSKEIFGNRISDKAYAKACKTRDGFVRQFGDDSATAYDLRVEDTPIIGERLGVRWLRLGGEPGAGATTDLSAIARPVVIGNIRMGFGHYRIAMAMASAARALGCTPLWFDLCDLGESTCARIIRKQNGLYSLGSRLSQKSGLFNKLYWEPLNSEGFAQLSYNAADQKTAELFAPVYAGLPRDIPFVATHAWCAQGAIHAGLTHVVNAIPDNWPMALHYAEGALHTVQTPFAYEGYRVLRGMNADGAVVGDDGAVLSADAALHPMPEGSLVNVGHYVDYELAQGVGDNCAARLARSRAGEPLRYLICVGGAGAQQELLGGIIAHLAPLARAGKAVVLINVGDHRDVWEAMKKRVPGLRDAGPAQDFLFEHIDDYTAVEDVCCAGRPAPLYGMHVFCNNDIFAAVYSTNELMRICDVLITKPSELAYYPVPKLMIRRVGGHEAYGAIRAHEVGDGTAELSDLAQITAWIDALQADPDRTALVEMCAAIQRNKDAGLYDGALRAVRLALAGVIGDGSN